ncbi:NAD(P)-binding protein [Annulohypoxylon maeteangense]|uniref:NAD(P)-binding protein n=1 Tax=Annulohypoxylon maeteangense TaxID=1927788 RepID=UPI0020083EA3|nr:NAD(P)-binding protein [Annulohypoxylon maeteangense]KAI0888052.1 NAD(P)-binding protein [Annulohypoxylon maeteangense]
MASTAAVIGSTGLTGSHILSTLLGLDAFKTIRTISRRAPAAESPKLTATVEPDTTKWASSLFSSAPPPSVVFSSLGTTRAQAGGIANQWKIDHDLNVELIKAAHNAGVKTFVFVSSAGTRGFLSGYLPYSKMKIGVEDAIKDSFAQAIILRPGLIMGQREVEHAAGPLLNTLVRGLGKISQGAQDAFGQESEVIARAAVRAAVLAAEGKAPSKYWVLEQADIVKLGRDEYKA